jgi:hypothetical protein
MLAGVGPAVENPRTGRLEVVQTAESTGGTLLVVHARYRPSSQRPPSQFLRSRAEFRLALPFGRQRRR